MDFRPTYTTRPDLPFTLGLNMPFVEGRMDGETPRWMRLREMAQTAEDVGFDALWVSDHMGFEQDSGDWNGAWEAWTLLSALAASTSRVQLGNFVLAVPFRNPALLAKMAETLDEISGGRVILGIGAGWNKPEFDAFDFPYKGRFDRFEDAIRIITAMLRTGRADHKGHVVSARGALIKPRGPRPEGLPVMVGAGGPRMMRLTAELADAWDGGNTKPNEAAPVIRSLDEICEAVGRDPKTLARSFEAVVRTLPARDGSTAEGNELRGSTDELAAALLRYAPLGIQHLVITVRPQTPEAVQALRPIIEAMASAAAGTPTAAGRGQS
jgi:probable F420-dependent oxidoreductase